MTGWQTAARNLARKRLRQVAGRLRWGVKVGQEGITDARHAVRRAGEGVRDDVVNLAKRWFRRVRRPVRTALRRKRQLEEQWSFFRATWDVEGELETIVGRGRLLVAGPWISEVGFETLYWVPFLHWVKAAFRLPEDRLVAVSRGGVASWYQGVASRYVEIWDHVEPAEFARRNAERGMTKHVEPSPLDADILVAVARHLGTREFDVIHPGLMYRLFTLYWSGHRAMGFVDAHTRFTTHAATPMIDPALLPREYVAVKFYGAQSLPDTPQIRGVLRSIVSSLAERLPVVLLDTGLLLADDHADYRFGGADVISARPWMTPQTNLGVQTQVAAGARAFVGTCGSITWLAPRLGVDTAAMFVDPQWLHAHIAVAMRAYHKLDAGRFAVTDLRALDPANAGSLLTGGRVDARL
ncbi:MAG: hypothetical protein HYY76_11925 [Acidobacteria bacterium]|nr:hypothetical protein [Acidobacteriota bacterium]